MIDRENRETWQKAGSRDLYQRACDEVESRLAAYTPIDTDAQVDGEMRRMIVEGMSAPAPLPVLPPLPDPGDRTVTRGRRPNRRRAS